jgi:hypothetical protein
MDSGNLAIEVLKRAFYWIMGIMIFLCIIIFSLAFIAGKRSEKLNNNNMEIITHKCDILECQQNVNKYKKVKLQVIFTTEQTEGKSVEPYLDGNYSLDLCHEHYNKVLDGNYVHATGAQGRNQFYFKGKRE